VHPVQRRYYAEDLVRRRRSDERRRYLASQQTARIDPNPHQIDAVVFALARIPEGGCILADEVGLGKTIEAGLIVSQLLAEGARRILLITPKPLVGQWRHELGSLFGLDTREGSLAPGAFAGDGVFLVGREQATGEKGLALLRQQEPFDLCVVDEAHEIFAGLYKRFTRSGEYNPDSRDSAMAGRLRELLAQHATPVLLLTATPIQNSLTELWGLVHYVDRSQTLLGNLHTFREVFTAGDDRTLAPGLEHELRTRMSSVVKRTLRRQAQEFMERPFVGRHAEIFEYSMSPEEKALYDDVTDYLLEPDLCAFRGSQRRLLIIGFHRRMASSTRALAASLDKVAKRLRGQEIVEDDLEDEDLLEEGTDEGAPPPPAARVQAELERVEAFAARARSLSRDSKAEAFLKAVEASGQVVVFTENLTTQDYLRERLLTILPDEEITIFRGTNDSARAAQALQRWREEVPGDSPSRDVAVRLALVHEFKTRSRVFISTEAGAKGLNLQFCSTVINYDLPWNPQRIEQRIGRCHRYGQTRDVTVINFLDKGNEAQRLLLQILTDKLDLFGTVLGASDQVLHSADLASALGTDLEARLRRIYERARTLEEIEAELRALDADMGARRQQCEEAHQRTIGVIQSRLDEAVRPVFRRIQEELKTGLAELDRHLRLVAYGGLDGPPLTLADPRVAEAVLEARAATEGTAFRLQIEADPAWGLSGRRGHLVLGKAVYEGFEPTERLLPAFLLEGDDDPLPLERGLQLMERPMREGPPVPANGQLEDALELVFLQANDEVAVGEEERFARSLRHLERFMEDRLLLLRRERTSLTERLAQAEEEFLKSVGAEQRTGVEKKSRRMQAELEKVEATIERLERRDDADYERLREGLFERRYRPPRLEKLLEAEVTIL